MSRTHIELHRSRRSGNRLLVCVDQDPENLPTRAPMARSVSRDSCGDVTIYRKLNRWLSSHEGATFDSAYSAFLSDFVPRYPKRWQQELITLFKSHLPEDGDVSKAFITRPASARELRHFPFVLRDGKICRRSVLPGYVRPSYATPSFIPVPVPLRKNPSLPEAWRRLGSVWYRFQAIPSISESVYLPQVSKEATPFEVSGRNPEFKQKAWGSALTCSKAEIRRQILPEARRLGIDIKGDK